MSSLTRRFCLNLLPAAGVCTVSRPSFAASIQKPVALDGLWGDQGDGTFVNPILPADYSDIDAIRVGDDFYAVSSTIHVVPGIVVMHSKDLVNWRTLGHAVLDVSALGETLAWSSMSAYGRGVWAGAIRFHEGRFWIYFTSPDAGLFVTTARDPSGPWSPLTSVWAVKGFDDPCPFWDDDGQGYLVATRFVADSVTGRKYDIHLFKLSNDGLSLDAQSARIIHQSPGSEANKLYKINGLYYHYFSEVREEGRVPMMNRSTSLAGPWETRQLGHVHKRIDKEPNQGGLIDVGGHGWWFLTHQGTGDWEGRALCLLPVTWRDGWPIVGTPGDDGIGNMVWRAQKPIPGHPVLRPSTSDDFKGRALGTQWEWNHAPRPDKWSLSERKGSLRLHAFRPARDDGFLSAGNTLSQRVLRTRVNACVAVIDMSGLRDGQLAGLCHFSKGYALFGIRKDGENCHLVFQTKDQELVGPTISQGRLWLRSLWGEAGDSQFAWSLDGHTFQDFGPIYLLTWGAYRGDRIGLFCLNPKADEGYVDVEHFTYDFADQTGQIRYSI